MRRKILLILIGMTVTFAFALAVTGFLRIPLLQLLEFATYDARVRLTAPGKVDPRVVIVDIDEKSLRAEGRWPWRRDLIGQLVDRLVNTYDVEIVAFDMVFAEKERNFSIDHLFELAQAAGDTDLTHKLERYEPLLDRDAVLADRIRDTGRVVLGYYFHHREQETGRVGKLPPPLFPTDMGVQFSTYAVQATGYAANYAPLQHNALAGGFFSNPVVDVDGVYRRVPLLVEADDGLYASLALAAAQSYLGLDAEPVFAPGGDSLAGYPALEALDLAGVTIPLDANATALVPYKGPEGSFAYVSATDILRGGVESPERLAGTIVLVGTTAAGLVDLRPTPVQNVYPGVEVHANLIAGILDGTIKQQPAYTIAVEFLMVVGSGILLAVLLPLTGPLLGGAVTFGVLGVVGAFNAYAWYSFQHVIPFASSLAVITLVYVINTIYGFFFESRSRNQLGRLFGQYVPPELVDEMSRDPGAYSLEGEKRALTVLFSDVRNFTAISESMDPHELTRMMNSFLTPLTRAVHQNKGTIDKYMGDAMMAFWGAPLPDPEHAEHAVETSLRMVDIINSLQARFHAEGWAEIRVGIGINTGEMSVGNMGSEFRVAYTVMGDSVNLGSRLEGLTKRYGVSIIVSEYTVEHTPSFFHLELDQVRVKGKAKPVAIYTPIGKRDRIPPDITAFAERHADALRCFRERRFDEAFEWFSRKPVLDMLHGTYAVYRERIDTYRDAPPPDDWDGVFEYETK
ncbi:MAG: adenylate/guanylate cyclase domain-containing protein [Proteobacteria bacterium]|nr:MAG: adenylate/guanylate cyclase domain-containing protein [Pseudomonadota bacterium]